MYYEIREAIIMIYVFLADGFEEIEALAPVDILRRGGVEVKTVGVTGKTVIGSHNIPVTADIEISQAVTDGLEAIVLPGGIPGTPNLEKSSEVQSFIDYCTENKKYICAICAAPSILGHKGLLKGKKATAYPTFQAELDGAEIAKEPVVLDGNIITARGAGVSLKFGAMIASKFFGEQKAMAILASMQCE